MSGKQKVYNGEFKQYVVEDMLKNKLGYNETQRKYNISRSRVRSWEQIYKNEGAAGLFIERRGRACAAGGSKKGRPPKQVHVSSESLISENEQLRAENDYLKNLHALVSKRLRQESVRK